jgi:hypothetical protein
LNWECKCGSFVIIIISGYRSIETSSALTKPTPILPPRPSGEFLNRLSIFAEKAIPGPPPSAKKELVAICFEGDELFCPKMKLKKIRHGRRNKTFLIKLFSV